MAHCAFHEMGFKVTRCGEIIQYKGRIKNAHVILLANNNKTRIKNNNNKNKTIIVNL